MQPTVFGLGLDHQVAVPGIEIELAVGAGEIIELAQLDAGGTQAEFEILKVIFIPKWLVSRN